jgi:hypothetical protein
MLVDKFTEKLLAALARAEELEALALQGGGIAMQALVDDIDDGASVGSRSQQQEKQSITGEVIQAGQALSEEQELQELIKLPPGSILDIPSLSGARPIHLCGDFGAIDCLKYLLSLGINPNSQDTIGETPLHRAARKSYFDVYSLLKAAGAKEFIENSMRETPHQLLHDQTMY